MVLTTNVIGNEICDEAECDSPRSKSVNDVTLRKPPLTKETQTPENCEHQVWKKIIANKDLEIENQK